MSPADIAVSLLPFFAGWTIAACPYDSAHWCDLVRSDGATVRVYAGRAGWVPEGRVEIAGVFPRTKDGQAIYGEPPPKITCSIARGAKTIAAEIARRLLPEYLARFDHLKAIVTKQNENADEADVIAARLVAQLGEGAKTERAKTYTRDVRKIWSSLEGVYRLQVRPAYGEQAPEVDMELHGIAPETAAAILSVLQEAEARATAEPVRIEAPASRETIADHDVEELEVVEPLRRRIA